MKAKITGIPWHTREDYEKLSVILEDSNGLPDTFGKWIKSARRRERELKAQGRITFRVQIDPDLFPGWCIANGMNLDSDALSEFANLKAFENMRHGPFSSD